MTDVPEKSSASGEFEIELSVCDGAGGSRRVTVEEAREPLAPPEWLWVHLNHMDPEHARWLRETSGLDPVTCDALLEEETRPRLVACGDNAMMESFFSLLQKNVLDRRRWRTRAELTSRIVNWVERTYHRRRRQRRLGKLTPVEFELVFQPQDTAA